MKQVPASSKVDIDPETGAMKRMSGETRTNPYDLFALETALQIREKVGGTVTVLTMGPPQAEEMMRDAYTMGADDAVILSDRKFAGADVLATSYALAQGIQVIGGADLIICGRQTTDGDTAQVGPAIAEHLTIPHAAWVAEIVDVNEKAIQVRQDLVSVSQISEIPYPCLLTIDKDTCVPRLPSYLLKKATADRPIRILSFEDMPVWSGRISYLCRAYVCTAGRRKTGLPGRRCERKSRGTFFYFNRKEDHIGGTDTYGIYEI